MKDEEKTKEQLLAENESLRAMFRELSTAERECRWVEAALRESEERYKRLLESITDYIYTVKVENGRPISTSHGPGCLAVTGYTSEYYQIYPNLWYEMIHERDREAVLEQAEKLLKGEAVQPLEHRIIHKDGSIRWVRNTSVPHYDNDGNLVSYDGIIVNITEEKNIETALRERERLLSETGRMAHVGGWEFDAETLEGTWTEEVARIHEMDPEVPTNAAMGLSFYNGESRKRIKLAVKEAVEQGKPYDLELELVTAKGNHRWVRTIGQPIKEGNKVVKVRGSFQDITERKQAEERILKLSRAVEQSPAIVMITDTQGNIEYVNPRFAEVTGYISQEVIGRNAAELGEQPAGERERMWETINAGGEWRGEFPNRKKDGEFYWESAAISSVRSREGIITNFIKVAEDITERKKAEEKHKALYEFSQKIVSNLDLDFRLRTVCQAVSEMGYRMAWIGTLKEDTKDVIPMAQAGFEDGYLSSIKVKFDDSPLSQGPTGRAIRNKRPEVQSHITTDPRYESWKEAALKRSYRSSAAFPIIDKDKVIAILNVYHIEDEFPQGDVDFLQTFANQAAAYIKNAQLFGELKESADRLKEEMEITSHLLMISEATSGMTDIDKLMEQVVHCSHEIVKCDICLSYLWDSETRSFRPSQAHGLSHNLVPLFRTESLEMKVGVVKEAMKKREPVFLSPSSVTLSEAKGLIDSSVASLPQNDKSAIFPWLSDINTIALIPLIGRKGQLGMIVGIYQVGAGLKPAPTIEERDMKVMKGISHQVSIALEEARLFKESVDRTMELSHRIETIQTMHEIDRSILSTLKADALLETVTRLISKVIPCERATVSLVDMERGGFIYKAGFGTAAVQKGAFVPFADTSTKVVFETGRAEYVSNLPEMRPLLPIEKRFLDEGFFSHIRVPITIKGDVAGILTVGAKRVAAFTKENLSTLEYLCSQIGVALSNAGLISDLEELFISVVKSLSSAIDAKSPWTAGHSERVTKYALDIAKQMGLSEKELKDLELAGLLHDVGKIGTYEAILDKPARLNEEEQAVMRLHPVKGAEILAPIKQLKEIIPGVKYHHEFYDGTGYPDGLKGEAIPLHARILTVADTVDAMGADRPYREGRGRDVIVAELKRCSGTQFDPKVVEGFLKTM